MSFACQDPDRATGAQGMRGRPHELIRHLAFAIAWWSFGATAASDNDVLDVDLDPLIEAAAAHPAQFAVTVPHEIRPGEQGQWNDSGDLAVWRYTVRVPSAVTVSFYAPEMRLPAGARLVISGGGRQFAYTARSVRDQGFWSDLLPGDSIAFELTVPESLRGDADLQVTQLQIGYRALTPGMRNHPSYDAALRRMRGIPADESAAGFAASELLSEACARNYACHAEFGDANAAAAVAAVVIRNMFLCTGTLINDVPRSESPFVLLARHCQGGSGPGGDPGAALHTRYYWNATDACGSTLSSVFDSSTISQVGATTQIEQEDLWLVRLLNPPPVDVVAYAGWDATGASFVGGFSTHHAAGRSQQITVWHAAPFLATFTTPWYTSRVWRTVNSLGNIGHGASGGALFDPAGRTVGVLSRGSFASGNTDDYGICPATPLLPPTETRWAGEFVALGPIWNSNADASSTTNPRTLRAVLDPQDSGTLVVDAIPPSPPVIITLDSSPPGSTVYLGSPLILSWTTQNATDCEASGGGPGSNWPGPLPLAGSRSVMESEVGTYTYSLECSNGLRQAIRQVTKTWAAPPAYVTLTASPDKNWAIGTDVTLTWNSTVSNCEATGGLPGDGWAGSKPTNGSQVVRSDVPDSAIYVITCGVAPSVASADLLINWPEMSVYLGPNDPVPPQIRIGQIVDMRFFALAATCMGTGGSPGDGWAGPRATEGHFNLTSTVPGTFTYRYECVSGANTASAEATLTWVDLAPTINLAASPARAVLGPDGRSTEPIWFNWTSNVKPCRMDYSGPSSGIFSLNLNWIGSRQDRRSLPGTYTYTMNCGAGADATSASVDVEWYWPAAAVSVGVNPAPGQPPYYPQDGANLVWQSNISPCTATGGGPGDNWPGLKSSNSSLIVRPTQPGTFDYGLTCGPQGNQASASVAVQFSPPPAPIFDAFQASPPNPTTGEVVYLGWVVRHADACIASRGYPGDTWPGPKNPRTDSVWVAAPVPGVVTYRLTCSNAAGSTSRDVDVNWTGTAIAFASISAQPSSVILGESVTVTWWSERATSCEADGGTPGDGWAGMRGASGSVDIVMSEIGFPYFAIRCADSRWVASSVRVNAAAAPVVTMAIDPGSVPLGASATISWNVTGSASCQASGGTTDANPVNPWQGTMPVNGSRSVSPTNRGVWNYQLTCTAPGSLTQNSVQLTVTDPINPLITFSIDPPSVVANNFFSLNWNVIGATTCAASGGVAGDGWTGDVPHVGTRTIRATVVGTHSYGLECSSATGATSARLNVTVTPGQQPPNGGGGGGGGGSMSLLSLAMLGVLALRGRRCV